MFGFGGSNDARFFQCLKDQDAIQKELLEQLKSKDEQIVAKDERQQELLHKYEVQLKANGQQHADILNLTYELKTANDQILGITGKRNLRGALELVAGKLDASSTRGVLEKLEKDAGFVQLLERISEQQNLRKHDIITCLNGLYHSFSKAMHGSEATLCIRFADVTAPAERAALVAIFERYTLRYTCVDESGATVALYSPEEP